MVGPGASGSRLTAGAALALLVFAGCGGSSKTNGESGDEQGGNAGTSASGGTGNGGSGTSGSSMGGSSRGGTGAAGAMEPPGPSFCGGAPCDPPRACCMTTGECFDPATESDACAVPDPDDDPQGRQPCASSAQCAPGEFCTSGRTSCRVTGYCQPIDNCGSCESSEGGCRVCGCDGNTYLNPQMACLAGVNVASNVGVGCGEPSTEGGAGSSSIGPREYTPCGHDAQCPAGNFCCTFASRCYLESDRDICIPPPAGTRLACKTSENCGDREYCRGEGCTGPGGCVSFGSEEDCGVTFELVCGCDGTTYTSAACAETRGVRIDHDGECGAGD